MRYVIAALVLSPLPLHAAAQVAGTAQAGDVQPDGWEMRSLNDIVSRYGCTSGYPDATFRGNRPVTRYEFAAALNACLDVLKPKIAANEVPPDDRAKIARLRQEFRSELATLNGRVDALERRSPKPGGKPGPVTTKLDPGGTTFGDGTGPGASAPADQPAPPKRKKRKAPASSPEG